MERVLLQLVPAVKKRQLDHERHADDLPAELAISLSVAAIVPPVASRSSTASTRWPGLIASSWIASASRPYSSSYSTSIVLPGSLPSLRTGNEARLQLMRDRSAEDEAP